MTGTVQKACFVVLTAVILATLLEGKFLFAESVEAVGK